MLKSIIEPQKRQLNQVQKALKSSNKAQIKIPLSQRILTVQALPVAAIIILIIKALAKQISRILQIRCQVANKCQFRLSTSNLPVTCKPSQTWISLRQIATAMCLLGQPKQQMATRSSCFSSFIRNRWEHQEGPSAMACNNSTKLAQSSRHLAVDLMACQIRTAWSGDQVLGTKCTWT